MRALSARRTLEFVVVVGVCASCAAHNAHSIVLDGPSDVRPLVREAFENLAAQWRDQAATPEPLPENSIALAVDIDDVPVTFWRESGDTQPLDTDAVRVFLEEQWVELLGSALVAGVTTEEIERAELRLNAWLAVDLRSIDAARMQVLCALTHRDRPERVLAQGSSKILIFDRLRCFGCRDGWVRDTGTRLDPPRLGRGGLDFYLIGWLSPYRGHHGYGHSHGRATYTKSHR